MTKIAAVLLSYLIIQPSMVSCPVTCSAHQPAQTQHHTDELNVLTDKCINNISKYAQRMRFNTAGSVGTTSEEESLNLRSEASDLA